MNFKQDSNSWSKLKIKKKWPSLDMHAKITGAILGMMPGKEEGGIQGYTDNINKPPVTS